MSEYIINLSKYSFQIGSGTKFEFMNNELMYRNNGFYFEVWKPNQEIGSTLCSGTEDVCRNWVIKFFQDLIDKDLPDYDIKVIWW